MKLFHTTQFHMLGLEIVLHYVALMYEIVSHFELAIETVYRQCSAVH